MPNAGREEGQDLCGVRFQIQDILRIQGGIERIVSRLIT